MTEHRHWSLSTPCVWEGQPTTIGAVQREYKRTRPAYAAIIPRAIANGNCSNHDELMRYDMAITARRRAGGLAAAKNKPYHVKAKGKNEPERTP